MTTDLPGGRMNRTLDLHSFALRELFEFIRLEEPAWPEGAFIHEQLVDGKVHAEMLMTDEHFNALANVLARCTPQDQAEAQSLMALRQAMLKGGFPRGLSHIADDHALLDAAELTRLLHWSLDDLEKAVAARRVFFLQATGTPLYPGFYADTRYNRKQLEAVTKRLGDLTGGSKWQFFTSPKGSLGGVTPLVALLDGKLALVKKCADGFLQR